ncbi:GntR family transcriptional regulator [Sedimentitalea sp. JM2-8]|uniref:GntR family transcriptional regulator n=1 Tax=Sedimentitalea xiamensis TaxID=3050037 RepID=A0ABT7FIA1_9RHOB|nr:GntR family transcriptional regulator [Sedimentitalea xiamensis]MDK3074519.1 GntR family transcriptional regulator [Sedimentitalea xiamensis]
MQSISGLRIESSSIRNQAYERLLELILNGTLPPGARLDLTQLSTDMGVSKTPVKEAIQRLIEIGMIEVKPRSGTFVSTIDPGRTVQNFRFRLALEIGCGQEIVERIDEVTMTELRSINGEMRRLGERADNDEMIRRFLPLDAQFHNRIIDLMNNEVISDRYRQTGVLLQVMRLKNRHTRHRYLEVVKEHDAILRSLENTDTERFRCACRRHVEAAIQRFTAHDGITN